MFTIYFYIKSIFLRYFFRLTVKLFFYQNVFYCLIRCGGKRDNGEDYEEYNIRYSSPKAVAHI